MNIFTRIWDALISRLKDVGVNVEISDVNLEEKLDKMSADQGEGLQWHTSVVDFLKLIGADSSRENRDALAEELGIAGYVSGSAAGNEALRAALFQKIKDSGGNIPDSLLD